MAPELVNSASDQRTVNNTMRHQYRVLSDAEKANMAKVKDMGLALHDFVARLGNSRELSLSRTKIEEAVMWAVKHITGALLLFFFVLPTLPSHAATRAKPNVLTCAPFAWVQVENLADRTTATCAPLVTGKVRHRKAKRLKLADASGAIGISVEPIIGAIPLLIRSADTSAREIARLGNGGCIRGPFQVSGERGALLFKLEAGVSYPTGCSAINTSDQFQADTVPYKR